MINTLLCNRQTQSSKSCLPASAPATSSTSKALGQSVHALSDRQPGLVSCLQLDNISHNPSGYVERAQAVYLSKSCVSGLVYLRSFMRQVLLWMSSPALSLCNFGVWAMLTNTQSPTSGRLGRFFACGMQL